MHINVLRDIPFILGVIAMLIGIFRNTPADGPAVSYSGPQWMSRVIFFFVGIVLMGYGILGNYSPH